jgi:hypothetical protein
MPRCATSTATSPRAVASTRARGSSSTSSRCVSEPRIRGSETHLDRQLRPR